MISIPDDDGWLTVSSAESLMAWEQSRRASSKPCFALNVKSECRAGECKVFIQFAYRGDVPVIRRFQVSPDGELMSRGRPAAISRMVENHSDLQAAIKSMVSNNCATKSAPDVDFQTA